MTAIGLIIPPDQPPERFVEAALAAERAGLDDVWLWEDCFAEGGLGPAGAILGATSRITVGVGLLPVPLRSVALTAMELGALARMFPGRFVPAIGHGVLDWMGQVGARAGSPMTLLEEYAVALRALLAGEEVSSGGAYVRLDRVQLRWPPAPTPVLIGAVRPKTTELAGRVGDGVLFTGDAGPEGVATGARLARAARAAAGVDAPFEVASFVDAGIDISAAELAARLGEFVSAGADRLAVVAIDEARKPLGDERILAFGETLAVARSQLGRPAS